MKTLSFHNYSDLIFAADHQLMYNVVGSIEGIFNKTINNIYYIDANQKGPVGSYAGADARQFYSGGSANRINTTVTDAILLKNTDQGYSLSPSHQNWKDNLKMTLFNDGIQFFL
ncbi:MAG: hypothetical protein IPI30_12250 [Saprospiraceae bacterium]|nr:hypothetical protein [Candidatus Vicinibacter affinis]